MTHRECERDVEGLDNAKHCVNFRPLVCEGPQRVTERREGNQAHESTKRRPEIRKDASMRAPGAQGGSII